MLYENSKINTKKESIMKKTMQKKNKDRIAIIRKILKAAFPNVKTRLRYRNPFELLVATILSAQCTDKQVNSVTKDLFNKLKTPEAFAYASIETIEKLIRPTGFFRNKTKNIKKCSAYLIEKYNSEVPKTLDELVKLPGVGRKTANVVLGAGFGIPGIVVDTHVTRISRRLGLTENHDPVKIEFDLMKIIPKNEWNDFCLQLIYFGRSVCKARKPECAICPLNDLCDSRDKIL
jgi:endonuclease-3